MIQNILVTVKKNERNLYYVIRDDLENILSLKSAEQFFIMCCPWGKVVDTHIRICMFNIHFTRVLYMCVYKYYTPSLEECAGNS